MSAKRVKVPAKPVSATLPPVPKWQEFAQTLERVLLQVLTVGYVLASRDAELPTLKTIKAMVAQTSQLSVDATTLRVLSKVYGSVVQLDDRGRLDDEISVKIDFATIGSKKRPRSDGEATASPTTSTTASRQQPRSFNAKPPKLAPLAGIIEMHKAALAVAVAAFALRCGAPDVLPPALRDGERCSSDDATTSAEGANSSGGSGGSGGGDADADERWQPGQPVTTRNFCAFVRHETTTPEYRGQLVHVVHTPARGGATVPVAATMGATTRWGLRGERLMTSDDL
jgi:hypothetical protein